MNLEEEAQEQTAALTFKKFKSNKNTEVIKEQERPKNYAEKYAEPKTKKKDVDCKYNEYTNEAAEFIDKSYKKLKSKIELEKEVERQLNRYVSPEVIREELEKFHSLLFHSVHKDKDTIDKINAERNKHNIKENAEAIMTNCFRYQDGTLAWLFPYDNEITNLIQNIRPWGTLFINLEKILHCGTLLDKGEKFDTYRVNDITTLDIRVHKDRETVEVFVNNKKVDPETFTTEFVIPLIKKTQEALIKSIFIEFGEEFNPKKESKTK